MNWYGVIGILSGLVQLYSMVPYVKDIFHGTTRPNIVSFCIWTFLQVIGIAAQWSAGASWSLIILIACTFNTLFIIWLGMRGYGYARYGKLDWICLVLAILSLLLWYATNNPLTALVLIVIADMFGSIPTLVKTYREPRSEIPSAWFIATLSAVLAFVSSEKLDLINLLYPGYLIGITAAIGILALRRKDIPAM